MKQTITLKSLEQIIYNSPEKWQHIRKIARNLNCSPETIRKYVAILTKKGIVVEKNEGITRNIRANLESNTYLINKKLYNLKKIYESGIIPLLNNYYNPETIVLFGSYSRGEDISESDIDLAIITDKKQRPNLKKYEKILGRKINLSLLTKKQISNEFFNNLINGIVLSGVLKNE